MKFDKETKVFMETYELDESLFWDCHGSPILLHRGWLKVAHRLGIKNYNLTEVEFDSRVIREFTNVSGVVYSDADLVKGKDGKMQMADKVDAFERTTDEQVADAIAEVKNIKNKKVIKDEKSKS